MLQRKTLLKRGSSGYLFIAWKPLQESHPALNEQLPVPSSRAMYRLFLLQSQPLLCRPSAGIFQQTVRDSCGHLSPAQEVMTHWLPPRRAGWGRRRQGEGQRAGLLRLGCPSLGSGRESSDGRRGVCAVPRKERSGRRAVA